MNKRAKLTTWIISGTALSMLGLSFAAEPLYSTFCRMTGFGGTTQVATEAPKFTLDRKVRVMFDANVAPGAPLKFRASQAHVDIKLGDEGVSSPVAFVLAVAMAVMIGLMAHFLVFRPLRSAAPLGKVIGSLGVMLYLQGVAQNNFGGTGRQPEAITPDGVFDNFLGLGKAYPQGTFSAIVFAIVMGLVLWGVFQFTRFGLATRAASSNEKGAVLLGYSPQLLAALNWVIASVLATVAAIVLGPTGGSLTPVGLSALVVASLGAALIGRLQSILITVAGGLSIGAVQSLLVFWSSDDWFPNFLRSGARDVVPFVVIGVVLFLRGKKLPLRGTVEEKILNLQRKKRELISATLTDEEALAGKLSWEDIQELLS